MRTTQLSLSGNSSQALLRWCLHNCAVSSLTHSQTCSASSRYTRSPSSFLYLSLWLCVCLSVSLSLSISDCLLRDLLLSVFTLDVCLSVCRNRKKCYYFVLFLPLIELRYFWSDDRHPNVNKTLELDFFDLAPNSPKFTLNWGQLEGRVHGVTGGRKGIILQHWCIKATEQS